MENPGKKNDGELKFCLVLCSGDLGDWSLKSSYGLLLFTLAFYFNVGWVHTIIFVAATFAAGRPNRRMS